MNIYSYWVGNYLYDYLLYLIVTVLALIVCLVFEVRVLIEDGALGITIKLFLLFGLANIPFTYILSNLTSNYGHAQAFIYSFNFIMGAIFPYLALVLRWSNVGYTIQITLTLAWFLRLFPAYAFG